MALKALEISTHTSRVGCDAIEKTDDAFMVISTHTSRVGCDGVLTWHIPGYVAFLLTHPVWDVTCRND